MITEMNFEDKGVYDTFSKWMNCINNQSQNNHFDKVTLIKLDKPYPYKSKKKRCVRKWWKNHSHQVELHDVELTCGTIEV